MNTVSFQNKGLIDEASIRTFGISAKETDSPIGFFGTGLKYAIAILLREGCEITIYRGHERIAFSTVTREIRGKEFQLVRMNGVEMGFTLELGKTWKMWQAFRELYCNTLDERGETYSGRASLDEDCTTIIVTGDAFFDEYNNRDALVLAGQAMFENTSIAIHNKPSNVLHFKSIRVGALQRPSIFTYNFTRNIDLTEDRTVKDMGQVHSAIRRAVICGDDKDLIARFLTAPKDTYEQTADMDWHETPSQAFMEVVERLSFGKITNDSISNLYKKHKGSNKVPLSVEMTAIEKQQLTKAIAFCHFMQFPVDALPINVTDDLADEVLGIAYNKQIYIARRTFMMGTKMVAATLIEEFLHIDKDMGDCTYKMQNFLFEKLVSVGEQLLGEAL